MGLKKHQPGCPCCEPCIITLDNFNRDSSTDLGANWTEDIGDAEIAADRLQIQEPGVVLINTHPHPASLTTGYVEVAFNAALNDTPRIFFNLVDNANYHLVEVEILALDSIACFSVYKVTASAATLLGQRKTLISEWSTIAIWMKTNRVVVQLGGVVGNPFRLDLEYVPHGTGFSVGLGSGAIATDILFDDFRFLRLGTAEPSDPPDSLDECPYPLRTCYIHSDWYDTNSTCGWDVQSGTWNADGELSTSSPSALIVSVNHQDLYKTVTFGFEFDTQGDEFTFYINFADINNNIAFLVRCALDDLTSGGLLITNSTTGTPLTPFIQYGYNRNVQHDFHVCIDETGRIVVQAGPVSGPSAGYLLFDPAPAITDHQIAFAAGAGNTGTVTFRGLSVDRVEPSEVFPEEPCEECAEECEVCADGIAPPSLDVSYTGWASVVGGCGGIALANYDTVVIRNYCRDGCNYIEDLGTWDCTEPGGHNGATGIVVDCLDGNSYDVKTLIRLFISGGNRVLEVMQSFHAIPPTPQHKFIIWRKTLATSDIDCSTISVTLNSGDIADSDQIVGWADPAGVVVQVDVTP